MSTASNKWEWHLRALDCIAHSALTNSKRPECLVKGVYPTHLSEGHGCCVLDSQGKQYIDFICGLGSNILGYGNEEIARTIYNRATKGCTLSLGTVLEVQVAEKVKEIVPWVTHLRFLKTGSDACQAAIRIARTKTGRTQVLSQGYHGWDDEFVSLTPPALGVPKHDNIRALKDLDDITLNTAAVIVEPVMTDMSDARRIWLQALREKCTKLSVILIFDEIITGFRVPKFTLSNYWAIEPDLICLGKAMANGMPLSVVAGKESLMNCDEYFVSSTFAGETLSLAAGLKTMQLLQTKYRIEELWIRAEKFLVDFNLLAPQLIRIDGYPTRGVFRGTELTKALFWQEACKAGILFGPSWFFNFAHREKTAFVLSTARDILSRISTGSVKLEGELPKTPFAQKQREAS